MVGDDRQRRLLGLDGVAAREPQADARRVEQVGTPSRALTARGRRDSPRSSAGPGWARCSGRARTFACSHSAMPSAVCTPSPCTNSCSANSPSASSLAISSVTSSPAVTAWIATTSGSPGLERAVEVGQADAVVLAAGAGRPGARARGRRGRLGIPDDQLVAVGVAREVAEQRARVQVGLLAPHPLQARLEVLAQTACATPRPSRPRPPQWSLNSTWVSRWW